MKRMLSSILGLVITLPVIGNAQAVNTYYPQPMRIASPVMPYQMNNTPNAGRWNPWMMPARVPMRPVMYRPNPGRHGHYPVARYQSRANNPRYPAPTHANTNWKNYRAGSVTPNRTNNRFSGVPAYGYRTRNSFSVPNNGGYHRARNANTNWKNYQAGSVAPNTAYRRFAGAPAYGYRAQNSFPMSHMGAYPRARFSRPVQQRGWQQVHRQGNINPYSRFNGVPAYGYRTHTPFPVSRNGAYPIARHAPPVQQRRWQQVHRQGNINPYSRFNGVPAYGYRTHTPFPVSRNGAYPIARHAPPVQRRGWQQVTRSGNINPSRTWNNVPARVNHYNYPSRAYRSPQGFTKNNVTNNWRRPAWGQYQQAPQRFVAGRYVMPASKPVIQARTNGFRAANIPVAWGANPYARNYATNVQPRAPKSYRMAYDYYRR